MKGGEDMKIAISASGPDLNSQVDPRFGRCPYFIIADPDTLEFEAVPNSSAGAMSGAGIQTSQMIANKGAEVVLTGSCGPNAFQTLSAAGIQVIVGVVGTVQDAIQRFKSGQLQPTSQPNVPSHFGMGAGMGAGFGPGMGPGVGRGMGQGMSMGRGMRRGMGGGMGMGRGMGRGAGMMQPGMTPPGFPPPPGMPQQGPFPPQGMPQQPMPTREQETEMLKNQAEMLKQQLEQIDKRLEELEKK